MKRSLYFTTSGLLLLSLVDIAFSVTATGTLAVTATIGSSCNISSATMAFGTYTGAANNASGTINVLCSLTTPYTIALNVGAGTGASFTNRVMTGVTVSNKINYNLYTTNARTTVWGDGTGSTATVAGVGLGLNQAISVFGTIPATQTLSIDSYTDSVGITITY